MPKVVMEAASVVQFCPHRGPHGRVHPTWRSRDGDMGVCQMSPLHLDNSIRMLIASLRAMIEDARGTVRVVPVQDCGDYVETETKLEILIRERRRRQR